MENPTTVTRRLASIAEVVADLTENGLADYPHPTNHRQDAWIVSEDSGYLATYGPDHREVRGVTLSETIGRLAASWHSDLDRDIAWMAARRVTTDPEGEAAAR